MDNFSYYDYLNSISFHPPLMIITTALFFFILNMIALGGGPTFAGWIMDLFKESYNELESVRYAMTVTSIFFIPSVISFLLVAKVLPRDWKAAEERNLKLAK